MNLLRLSPAFVVLLALEPAGVAGGEAPVAPWQQAEAVAKAFAAGDLERVRALAGAAEPDPWLVADELSGRGGWAAALAFSKAAVGKDTERLPAYLEATTPFGRERAAREALGASERALHGGDAAAALEALAGRPEPRGGVLASRVHWARALALKKLSRADDAASEIETAGGAALEVGWLSRASDALQRGASRALAAGDTKAATDRSERRVKVEESRGEGPRLAGALLALGYLRMRTGTYQAAVVLGQRALTLAEVARDGKGVGAAHAALGNALSRLGRTEPAVDHLERAVQALEVAHEKAGLASALGDLAALYYPLGRWKEAAAHFERSMKLREEVGDPSLLAAGYIQQGILYDLLGKPEASVEAHRRALAAYEQLGDASGQADALANLGQVQEQLGDFAAARASLERSLELHRSLSNRPGEAVALASLGRVLSRLADFPGALNRLDDARRLQEGIGDPASLASVHGELAGVYERLGDFDRALRHYLRAFDLHGQVKDISSQTAWIMALSRVHRRLGEAEAALLYEEQGQRLFGSSSKAEAAGLSAWRVGGLHQDRGDHTDALRFLESALTAMEAIHNDQYVARCLRAIGQTLRSLGRPRDALPRLAREREIEQRLGLRVEAAETLAETGRLHAALGEWQKALELAKRALEEAEGLGSVETAVVALSGMASAQLGLKLPKEASATARTAIERMATLVRGQSEESGSGARGARSELYATGIRASLALGDASGLLYFLESGRAGTLLESLLSRDAIQAAVIPRGLLDEERAARAAEAAALSRHQQSVASADPKARAEAKAGLASARTRLAEVIERIQRESKAAAHVLYPQAPTREVLARVLAPDEALILYALLAEVATALVVTAEQARIVPLGKTSLIVEAAEALKLSAPEGEPKAAILGLRKLIIAPLTLGPAVRRLLISPDGILSYAPFPLLAEAHEVVLVPSGATLAALRNEHAPRGEGVLALGNPDYGVVVPEPPGRLVQRDRKLLALPGSEEEARAIGSVVLLGKDATESGLRAALARKPRWRAVHLACHGLLERDRPMLSSLALTPEGEDDGRWTALDVFRTRVPTDLAFLSACETGKGKLVEGEGLVGLTRAFLFAGAPRVIASLWRVDDEATKALVVAFYERWGVAGTTVVQALREAQAVVRSQERWEHPYFWAAWELWGLPE